MTEPVSGLQTRWERRRELTRGRLLQSAEHLFRTQGFDATTVEEIAISADVAKGTLFNYFSSKEMLLGELLYLRIGPLLDVLPAEGAAAKDRIWALLDGVRRELSAYTPLFPRMVLYGLIHPLPELPLEGCVSLAEAVARLVRDGQEEGTFQADCDAEVAGALIATYFFRLSVQECLGMPSKEFCWKDRMEAALQILYRGLGVGDRESLAMTAAVQEPQNG